MSRQTLQALTVGSLASARGRPLQTGPPIYEGIQLSWMLRSIKQWPCLCTVASLYRHVASYWYNLCLKCLCIRNLWFVSYPCALFLWPRPPGFKNPRCMPLEEDTERYLDSGGPILASCFLFSLGCLKKMLFSLMSQIWLATFQQAAFNSTGYPHVYIWKLEIWILSSFAHTKDYKCWVIAKS